MLESLFCYSRRFSNSHVLASQDEYILCPSLQKEKRESIPLSITSKPCLERVVPLDATLTTLWRFLLNRHRGRLPLLKAARLLPSCFRLRAANSPWACSSPYWSGNDPRPLRRDEARTPKGEMVARTGVEPVSLGHEPNVMTDSLPRYADADGPFGMGPYSTLPHPIFLLLNHEQWAFRNRGSDSRPRQAMVSLSLGQGARVRCAGPSAGFVGAAPSRLPPRRDKAETM